MISFVQGLVDELRDDAAVIDVGGIGFEVQISGETAARLSSVASGEQVRLYTYMNVDREGAMSLIGFLSRDELYLFRLLITVSGVGPKAGLAVLSAMGADELRFAIASGDAKSIAKAPGVGKKTAERLVLELRDKLASDASAEEAGSAGISADLAAGSTAALAGAENEATEALTALGYARMEAASAVRKAEKALSDESESGGKDGGTAGPDTETLLRTALQFLG